MKAIALPVLLALTLAGCAAKQIDPPVQGQTAIVTPIEGARGTLVLPLQFQSLVVSSRPTVGKSWGAYTFDIQAGKAMSKALTSQLRARIPALVVGDGPAAAGQPSMTARNIVMGFGVDNGSTMKWMAIAGPLATMADARIVASATLTFDVAIPGKPIESLSVEGLAVKVSSYIMMSEGKLQDTIGMAIDDAASKATQAFLSRLPQR